MEQLRCISIISFILFFYIGAKEVTGQAVIIDRTIFVDIYNESITLVYDEGCECIKYNCGCCSEIKWDAVSLQGRLCANASYLEHDYGISLTLTYNDFSIINETVSARNPPPICVGEDIVDAVKVEICLHIYDIDIESDKFHVCFEILGKVMKIHISKIPLGCVNTKLHKHKKMQYKVGNTISNLFNIKNISKLFNIKTISNLSNISLPVARQEQMIAAYSRGSLPSHSLIEIFLFVSFLLFFLSVAHGII